MEYGRTQVLIRIRSVCHGLEVANKTPAEAISVPGQVDQEGVILLLQMGYGNTQFLKTP